MLYNIVDKQKEQRFMTKRNYCEELTREMLKEWGITHIDWCEREQQWWVNRYWYRYGRSKEKTKFRLKIAKALGKRKYTKGKEYYIVVFSLNGKAKTIPLARLVYAFFKGNIPKGMDVDHKNNDSLDNSIDNLTLLTREQNIAKRYIDNPDGHRNQYR